MLIADAHAGMRELNRRCRQRRKKRIRAEYDNRRDARGIVWNGVGHAEHHELRVILPARIRISIRRTCVDAGAASCARVYEPCKTGWKHHSVKSGPDIATC